MKANGTPERIWINSVRDLPCSFVNNSSIEYTRTDVFIDKAVEFMKNANLYLYHCISEECDYVDTDKFVDDFKNYMKM